jgi:hypothetical protein
MRRDSATLIVCPTSRVLLGMPAEICHLRARHEEDAPASASKQKAHDWRRSRATQTALERMLKMHRIFPEHRCTIARKGRAPV